MWDVNTDVKNVSAERVVGFDLNYVGCEPNIIPKVFAAENKV